ncbi:ferritin-like domain-containing protein [Acidithiobacillus ferrivorans]|uniref:ferritin-like domain-containing protein n=1 Tax=Acidithiobacillus ferrivorans TaxID=160808 RepID=UPI004058A440
MEITDRTCAFPVPNAKDGGHAPIPRRLHWSFEDLDFSKIDRERIQGRDDMFLLVCSASFMESSSETFTRNLLDYFTGDDEVGTWFTTAWEPEELQHGRALKAYVQQVWPKFNWDGAYADFFAEYAKLCTTDALEPTRGQEMVARCIVEMGTTTVYQALNAVCEEPVLRDFTWRIRTDEVQHYKHFYRYFLSYREQEHLHRIQVMATLWRRAAELRQSDANVALRHAAAWLFRGRNPPVSVSQSVKQVFALMLTQYPIELGARMTIKPLLLPVHIQRWIERPLAALARRTLLN